MAQLCVLGEYLIDFTPQGKSAAGLPLYAQNPGGAPTNVACAAAKLGASSAVITKISRDPFGQFLYSYLEQLGVVDLRGVSRSEDPTGLAFVTLAENGERDFVFYRARCADAMLSCADVDAADELLQECSVFHFSSVSLAAEVSRAATLHAARRARELGKTVSFDINYRPFLWGDEAAARAAIAEALQLADVVKASEEEALLFGGADREATAGAFLAAGASLALITLGAGGSCFDNGRERGFVPSFPVVAVDATGAGDNFMGAFLARLIQSGMRPEQLSGAQLRDLLRFSNAAGAVCASRFGAIAGQASEADIAALLQS